MLSRTLPRCMVAILAFGAAACAGRDTSIVQPGDHSRSVTPISAASATTAVPVHNVTVTIAPLSLAAGEVTQARATLRDSTGRTVRGRTVEWSSDNHAVASVSPTGLVTAISAGSANITATCETKSGSAPVTVTPVAMGPTITSLSRDAGSTAGGAVLRITGSGFGAGDVVKFGSAIATGVTHIDASTLQATVPPNPVGVVSVSVTHDGAASTLANAFEYLPARTTTFFSSDFESNTLSPFYLDGGAPEELSLSTEVAVSGTHSAKGTRSTTGGAGLAFNFGAPANPALTEPNGIYMRWYVYIPSSTIDNIQSYGAQVKITLFRTLASGGQPGYLMCGVGSGFGSRNLVCFVDNGILPIPGGYTNIPLENGFVEMETWYSRSGGTGKARLWVNGKHIFDYAHANMGSDVPTDRYWSRLGLVYTEKMTGPVPVYLDDVAAANGFIDP